MICNQQLLADNFCPVGSPSMIYLTMDVLLEFIMLRMKAVACLVRISVCFYLSKYVCLCFVCRLFRALHELQNNNIYDGNFYTISLL